MEQLRYEVLRRWLKNPSASYNVSTFCSWFGCGEIAALRLLSQLESDGLVQVDRGQGPLTAHLVDPDVAAREISGAQDDGWALP